MQPMPSVRITKGDILSKRYRYFFVSRHQKYYLCGSGLIVIDNENLARQLRMLKFTVWVSMPMTDKPGAVHRRLNLNAGL